MEIRAGINAGEVVQDFIVLDEVKFKAPKFKSSKSRALSLSKYDKCEMEGTLLVKQR